MMQHLKHLQMRHAALEKAIHEEMTRPSGDDLLIRRLKREKLHVKEEIARLERLRETG
jgi:hypothetical protein